MSILKTISIIILCSLLAFTIGYFWKARLSKAQVDALINVEVSERQDEKRKQILANLQEQIQVNETLLTKIKGSKETKQSLVEAQNALLIAKDKLADTIKAEAEDSKIIIALNDENAALYNTLDKTNDIIKDNNETIAELTEAVEDSTEELKSAKDTIEDSQEEISSLRNSLKDLAKIANKNKMFAVGFGVTMPLGIEIIFTMKIPKLPIGLFGSAALTVNDNVNMPINYVLATGLTLIF